jgi:hypothetical protein
VFYDIQTSEFRRRGKLRGVLTLDKTGDGLSGTARVEALNADDSPVLTLTHTLNFTRIKVELVE